MASGASLPIGIDFGSSYCTVGVFRNGVVDILTSNSGYRRTPSVVELSGCETGGINIGEEAKRSLTATRNPTSIIVNGVPKLIRGGFENGEGCDWIYNGFWDGNLLHINYKSENRILFPEQICAMLFSKLKESAEAGFKMQVTDVVLTVPPSFTYSQRQAVTDAAKVAGLNVLKHINAPVAAAVTYSFQRKVQGKRTILIFDFGGDNLGVAVVTIDNGWLVVKSCTGLKGVGGDYLDERLVDSLEEEFKKKHKRSLGANERRRLRAVCEKAKKKLSRSTSATVELSSFVDGVDLKASVTRARFEKLCEELFKEQLVEEVDKALIEADLGRNDIEEVVLVGGSSRIPKIEDLLHKFFDGRQLCQSLVGREEVVAMGAAIQASLLRNGDEPRSLLGIWLIDILPFALGVETKRGYMKTIIKKNSTFPTRRTEAFAMMSWSLGDNQADLDLKIFESMSPKFKWNKEIDTVKLLAIAPAPRYLPQIEVTFEIDAKGILRVTVVDQITGKENCSTITTRNFRLMTEELDLMIAEAEGFRADERMGRDGTVAKRNLRTLCSDFVKTIEKDIEEEKRRDKLRVEILRKCNSVLDWLAENQHAGREEVDGKKKELERSSQPLIANLFAPRLQPSDVLHQLAPDVPSELSIRSSSNSEISAIGDQPQRKRACQRIDSD